MKDLLTQKSCVEFTEVLSSKAPVPGGGGVAAMVGAFGIALCSMVGNLTIGRKKYASVENDVKIILERANKIELHLLELVDEDAAVFEPLSKAYSIPKDNPDRDEIMEVATKNACQAPMEMMRYCCEAIELLEEMLDKGSTTLVSDVGCGVLCCKAALESASMNVFVNTKTLKNRCTAKTIDDKADQMLSEYLPRAEAVAQEVMRRLRNEV